MRQVLANTLAEIANTDKRIVVLEADLMGCHATKAFKEAHPDRFVNVGIAEANMIGIAAGMSAMGKSRLHIRSLRSRRVVATTRFSSPSRTQNNT